MSKPRQRDTRTPAMALCEREAPSVDHAHSGRSMPQGATARSLVAKRHDRVLFGSLARRVGGRWPRRPSQKRQREAPRPPVIRRSPSLQRRRSPRPSAPQPLVALHSNLNAVLQRQLPGRTQLQLRIVILGTANRLDIGLHPQRCRNIVSHAHAKGVRCFQPIQCSHYSWECHSRFSANQ